MRSEKPVFTYVLREPGKALATLSVDGEDVEFELANVSNPLEDLLEGLVSMIITPSHLWGEENVFKIIWYGESSTYNWSVTHVGESRCLVHVAESVDFFGDDTESDLVEFECEFLDFVLCLVTELDKFIKHLGLLNYSQQWQKDEFPLTQFLFLKKVLMEHDMWSTKQATNNVVLAEEIKMLLA